MVVKREVIIFKSVLTDTELTNSLLKNKKGLSDALLMRLCGFGIVSCYVFLSKEGREEHANYKQ